MALCLGLPRWASTRKVKTNLDFTEQDTVSGSGISWAIFKSAPRSRQITMPAPPLLSFLQAGWPSCCPTNSIKALKANATKLASPTVSLALYCFSRMYFSRIRLWVLIDDDDEEWLSVSVCGRCQWSWSATSVTWRTSASWARTRDKVSPVRGTRLSSRHRPSLRSTSMRWTDDIAKSASAFAICDEIFWLLYCHNTPTAKENTQIHDILLSAITSVIFVVFKN